MSVDTSAGQRTPAEVPPGVGDRYRWAVARLRTAQKPAAVVPAYLRYVNRPLGGRLAALAFAVRATPDQVTAASGLTALVALLAVAVVTPSWWLGVLVAAGLLLSYALDSADGQLSRLRGGGSKAGEWLDHVVDIAKAAVLHSVVLVWAYRSLAPTGSVPEWFLLLPLAFLVVDVTSTFGLMLRDQLLGRARRGGGGRAASPVRSLLLLPVDHAAQCAVFALLGAPAAFVVAYTALGVVTAAFSVRALARSARALRDAA